MAATITRKEAQALVRELLASLDGHVGNVHNDHPGLTVDHLRSARNAAAISSIAQHAGVETLGGSPGDEMAVMAYIASEFPDVIQAMVAAIDTLPGIRDLREVALALGAVLSEELRNH